jgi:hypothetical protein
MRVARVFVRVVGWLLTPFVVLAASFFGAVLATQIAAILPNPTHGLVLATLAGGAAGYITAHFWLRFLRRSPRLQHALHVAADGTPETAELATIGNPEEKP